MSHLRRKKVDQDQNRRHVALTLMRTFNVEFTQHESQKRSPDSPAAVYDPAAFKKHFDEFVAEEHVKHDPHYENTEVKKKNPKDPQGYERIWAKLADVVIANRFDPETFVRRQFQVLPIGGGVYPSMLLSAAAIANYRRASFISEDNIRTAYIIQCNAFKMGVFTLMHDPIDIVTKEEAWQDVLEDMDLQMSVLYRYCAAKAILKDHKLKNACAFKKIISKFKTAAAVQYVSAAEDYDNVWGSFLPADWHERAQEIYHDYYGF